MVMILHDISHMIHMVMHEIPLSVLRPSTKLFFFKIQLASKYSWVDNQIIIRF